MDRTTGGRILLALLVVLAGCSAGGVTRFEADAATVSDSVVANTHYEYNGTTERTARRSFEVAGHEQNVTVVNEVATYEKAIEIPGVGAQNLAVVAVVSSPSISLAGKEFNPLADATGRDLAGMLSGGDGGATIDRKVGESTVETLGIETTVSRFAGHWPVGPTSLDVTVQVTKVKHGGDFVAVLAVYPRRLDDARTVRRMIRGLTHPG